MYNVVNVVYTTRKLSREELRDQKQYAFLFNGKVKIGDLLISPNYSTPLQVTNVYQTSSSTIDGKPLKTLIVDSINGNSVELVEKKETMKEMNSMFGGLVNKYKSQFIPQREDKVRMTIQGNIAVPHNGEYVGMDADGGLISYDSSLCIEVPIYSVNTTIDKVQVGDIVKDGNNFGKVLAINSDGVKILTFSGYTQNKKFAKDFLLNQPMVRVLVNMFNFASNKTGFNPIMFAMAEGDKFDVKSLLALSMMPEGKNLFNGINPMMLMMLDSNGGGSDMMSMMMFSQMMQGTSNPFMPQQPVVQQPVNNPTIGQNTNTALTLDIDSILSNPELVEKLKEALK